MEKIKYKLGEIATYINGYAFKPTDWNDKNEGLPIVRIQNLTKPNAKFNYTTKQIDKKYHIRKGDVLISWSATLDVFIWNGEEALLNQHIFKVEFNKLDIDKNYFVYLIKSAIDEMKRHVHGSTMTHITKDKFDNIPVEIPDKAEQERMVSVLNNITGPIDQSEKLKCLLNELKDATYNKFFENAETATIGELIEPYTAKRCGNGNYEVLSITRHQGLVLQKDRFKKEVASKDKSNYKIIPKNKLVVAFPIDEGLLSVQDVLEEGIVSPAYTIYSINENKIIPKLLEMFLRSEQSIKYYIAHLRGTTLRRRTIPKEDFYAMEIQLPSIKEQENYMKTVRLIDEQIANVEHRKNKLEEMLLIKMEEFFN